MTHYSIKSSFSTCVHMLTICLIDSKTASLRIKHKCYSNGEGFGKYSDCKHTSKTERGIASLYLTGWRQCWGVSSACMCSDCSVQKADCLGDFDCFCVFCLPLLPSALAPFRRSVEFYPPQSHAKAGQRGRRARSASTECHLKHLI